MSVITAAEEFATVTIIDGTGVPAQDGLGAVAIACADVALDGAGELFRLYSGTGAVAQAAIDLAASEITSSAYNEIVAAFAQGLVSVYIVLWNKTSGSNSVSTAFTNAETAGLRAPWEYAFVGTDSRAAADHVSLASFISTRSCRAYVQSGDGGWITSGVPSGYSTIVTSAKMGVFYEDTAATCFAAANLARVAKLNPDTRRTASNGRILSVLSEYTTPLTSAQKGHLGANNCNFHQVITIGSTDRQVRGATSAGALYPCKMLSGATDALSRTSLYIEIRAKQALMGLHTVLTNTDRALLASAAEASLRATLAPSLNTAREAGYLSPSAALLMPDGYKMTVTVPSGVAPVVAVGLDLHYNGEVARVELTGTLVTE